MASYQRSEENERRIVRCAACNATVFAEFDRADANAACAFCGMMLIDAPYIGGDYFDVIMRASRPMSRRARLRRAG